MFRTRRRIEMAQKSTIVVVAIMTAALAGCVSRRPQPAPSPVLNRSYVDLQPGWRVRVITPILKSGGFKVQTEQVKSVDGTIEIKTGDDFVGYEVSYYAVEERDNGGLAIRFVSAEVRVQGGKPVSKSKAAVSLFELPDSSRDVRLLFLTRVSKAEHDEAILSAPSIAEMDLLTTKVESNPLAECKVQREGLCLWVPQGLGVQVERRDGKRWIPAV